MRIERNKNKSTSHTFYIPDIVRSALLPGRVLVIVALRDNEHSEIGNQLETIAYNDPTLLGIGRKPVVAQITRTPHLFDHMSVFENLCLPHARFGSQKKGFFTKCQVLLNRFDMQVCLNKPALKYASEDRRLIELIRAYLQKPDLLILCRNMLSDLNPIAMNSFLKIIQAFRDDGCTIVYMCSNWEDSLRIGDNYAILTNGALQEIVLTAAQLRENPRKILYLLSEIHMQDNSVDDQEAYSALSSIYRSAELFVKDYELGKTLSYLTESINSIMRSNHTTIYIFLPDKQMQMYPVDQQSEKYRLSDTFIRQVRDMHEGSYRFDEAEIVSRASFSKKNEIRTLICLRFSISNVYDAILEIVYDRMYTPSEKQLLILSTFCNEIELLIDNSRLMHQSLLLRESHHRIKNNLQIVIGIIYNQKRHLRDNPEQANFQSELDSLISRVKNISMVHDMLTHDTTGGNFVSLQALVAEVLRLFKTERVEIKINVEDIQIIYKSATSLAMILNELLSNIFKHAFSDTQSPRIEIDCTVDSDKLALRISDNGCGLAPDFSPETTRSVGMSIVRSLAKSLNGSVEMYSESGTTVILRVPCESIATDSVM